MELAERDGHRLYLPIAQRARGVHERLAGELEAARHSFEAALAGFDQLGTRWQAGRTYMEMGELETTAGDANAARTQYQAALEHFEAIQARPYLERARLALQQ